MATQKFFASDKDPMTWPNGAIGHRPGNGPFDCLGPYAKVRNCPIDKTDVRLTCYATGYADTFFSIPAATQYKGKHVSGFFCGDDDGIKFVPYERFHALFNIPPKVTQQ